MRPVFACAVIFACPVMAEAACLPKDIELKQVDWRRESKDWSKIVGEIVNRCSEETGVQLQVTFRDAAGKVVDVEEFWPAGTINISPGASYPFNLTAALHSTSVKMESAVIQVRAFRR
jgi:hypothetical protein